MDLPERVVAAVGDGQSCRQVSALFRVSASSVVKCAQLARSMGSSAPRPVGGSRGYKLDSERGVTVSCDTLWRFLRAAGISFKKTVFASEQDRPDVARRRAWWRKDQGRIDLRRLVFIDATWAKTNMVRTHGRNQRGTPSMAKVPHGHWKTLTFLAALRHDRIAAPCVFDGPINGTSLLAYVRQFLVPTLKPGDVVIMDNLGGHKGWFVRAAIRAAGAKLFFLSPYSSDLNPIKQVFAKLKTLLRKAVERTVEDTWRRIGQLLQCFAPHECAAHIKNAEYASI